MNEEVVTYVQYVGQAVDKCVSGFCGCGIEHSASMKGGDFCDMLTTFIALGQ
jgi:hypothetical protein